MRDFLPEGYANADVSIAITRAEMFVLRAPCEKPVRTSFGTMYDRPAVFVRLEASDGAVGLGEVWCNFPSCGAEHRGKLLETAIFPALMESAYADPTACFEHLTRRFERLAVQTGEEGPIAQCIAGVDGALWDLVAKRAGVPLYQFLGGTSSVVGAYASGINPTDTVETVERCRTQGYTAFKLKIGFGDEIDLRNLRGIADGLHDDEQMMTDANQGWSVEKTIEMLPKLVEFPLRWLEEPILATSANSDWQVLAKASPIPLAAGENIMGFGNFDIIMNSGTLGVIQPDLCKWGGISGTYPVATKILETGGRYCPHFLGGGIGLAASAHLLAAVGGDGLLEIDSNANPLREDLFAAGVKAGQIDVNQGVGVGISSEYFDDVLAAQTPTMLTAKTELTK